MPEANLTPPAGSRPISRFPGYRICDGGQVWSCVKPGRYGGFGSWHIVKPGKASKKGYLQIHFGKKYQDYVHRLVLEEFVGPCPPGMEGCHNDGNLANNFVSNLRWDTPENNQADREKHGTLLFGEQITGSKLKRSDIPEIFRLSRRGISRREIARRYGVTYEAIRDVLRRRTWSHVQLEPTG